MAAICLLPIALTVASILVSFIVPSCHISESSRACGTFLRITGDINLLLAFITVPTLLIILLAMAVVKLWHSIR